MKRIATLSLALLVLISAAPIHAATQAATTKPAVVTLASDSMTTGTKSGDSKTTGTHKKGKGKGKKKAAKKAA